MAQSKVIRLRGAELTAVRASERTEWLFATIVDDEGETTLVEISHHEVGRKTVPLLNELLERVCNRPLSYEAQVVAQLGLSSSQLKEDLVLATAVSALRTAIVQLQAQYAGLSLTEWLGGKAKKAIPLYALLNPSLEAGRTPADFAREAERAVDDGFTILKCAPFDEVVAKRTTEEMVVMAQPGIERVAAIRKAVAADAVLLVDGYYRFTIDAAMLVSRELARLDVQWFEEPLQRPRDRGALAQLAVKAPIPLAGGEYEYGRDFFEAPLEDGALRYVMPDVKHCGGVQEAASIGHLAHRFGGQLSLHCPTGPVSQLASAHVTASVPNSFALEYSYESVPWRRELVLPHEEINEGQFFFASESSVAPRLNPSVVAQYG